MAATISLWMAELCHLGAEGAEYEDSLVLVPNGLRLSPTL
jgi:hypothetical protein